MILRCPACETRYLVDDTQLHGPSGRVVRCANCGHAWHQSPTSEAGFGSEAPEPEGRIEPALEVPPRPNASAAASLSIPPRPKPISERPIAQRRSRWAAVRWLVLVLLFALAIVAGVVVARGAVVAMWPPAERLFTLAGLRVTPPSAGLKFGELIPRRTSNGLIIEGEIANTGKTAQDLPPLRIALHDAAQNEVQFKVIDPPLRRLAAGADRKSVV